MRIKTQKLLDVLGHLKFIFVDGNYIENANYIYLNPTENIIWTYNNSCTYIHKWEGSVANEFEIDKEIAINAKKLHTLLKKITKEEIHISYKDNTLTVKNGRSTNKFSVTSIAPDASKLETKIVCKHTIPTGIPEAFKRYCLYDKAHERVENIIFEDECMVSSDRFNITRSIGTSMTQDFIVKWDVLKHILSKDFTTYGVFGDYLSFEKDGFSLLTENRMDSGFKYQPFFPSDGDTDYDYAIYMNKDEDISFIDAFLIDFKKLDKKVDVEITESGYMFITAQGGKKTEETRANVKIDQYGAGEAEKFKVNFDNFKMVYEKFDYFIVMEGMLLAVNVEDGVDRIVKIENLEA